jgi:predicted nuclease of predicted toxin-antitoxin system
MKLLFDQNISFRIMRLLPRQFADCRHVRTVGMNNCDDPVIWQFAKDNGFTVVTFDADFSDIASRKGFPPKIVRLRTGNLTTAEIAERLLFNFSNIAAFILHTEKGCLDIY